MRILLVEDDVKLCEAVAFALNEEGFEVDVCHDGDDGLRWAREGAHDLILLDRMLPVMDGVTVLRKLRSGGIATPVLLVTALGSIGQRVEGLDAGVEDGNLDNYIHFLRRRLRSVGSRILIQTVRGVGYRLEEGDV